MIFTTWSVFLLLNVEGKPPVTANADKSLRNSNINIADEKATVCP